VETVLNEGLLSDLLQEHNLFALFDKSHLKDFGLTCWKQKL
jgi:hypothetical protein